MLATETERMHYLVGYMLGAFKALDGMADDSYADVGAIVAEVEDKMGEWKWKAPKYVYPAGARFI